MKEELVEGLKSNWTAWGGLSEEERELLTENKSSTLFLTAEGNWSKDHRLFNTEKYDIEATVFRISPDFQPKAEPRFVEYPIVNDHGFWRVTVEHIELTDMRDHLLGELPSIVGFAGVQFEGQSERDWWHMEVALFIDDDGDLATTRTVDGEAPATPIKAQFYVG